jgi:hypothetical protein
VTLSVDDATITYTEDDDADAVDNYQIERKTGSGSYSVISTEAVGAAQPQHVDPNLAAGTYTYRVRGYDSGTDTYTAYSAERFVVVVSALTAGNATAIAGDSTVALTATAPTGGTAPYTYQWHRSTDGSKGSALSGATSLTHDDDTAVNDTLYYYTMTATDAVAASVDYTQRQATPGNFAAPDIAYGDFEDGTLGGFVKQGADANNHINVIDDSTGIRGGKVVEMRFVGTGDTNKSLKKVVGQAEEMGYGDTFYMAGSVFIPLPPTNMLRAQRKLFYPQPNIEGPTQQAYFFLKVEGYSANLVQPFQATTNKYPTGVQKLIPNIVAGAGVAYDTWTHVEARVTMNSDVNSQDGILQVWKDGVLVMHYTNCWFKNRNVRTDNPAVDTTLRGFGSFKIGDQLQPLPYDTTTTYDERRLWDNMAVSTTRIGPS